MAFAVAGQVYGHDVVAVVSQVTRLQNPHAVVVEYAVNHDDSGLAIHPVFTPGVSVVSFVLNCDVHDLSPGLYV